MKPPLRFSLVQLQRFLRLAEELHFTRAAERLNVSQPLLSAQMRDLEQALGAKLFERSSRKVQLSSAGILFRDRAQRILIALEDAVAATREVASGRTEPLRIGYTDEFARSVLPELVRALKAEQGPAEIHLLPGAVPQLVRQFTQGALDLVLLCPVPPPSEGDWRLQDLPSAELVVGIGSDHPLAAAPSLKIEQIADLPFVASTIEEAGSELLADRLFAEKQLTRRIAQRACDPHLMNSLAAAGVGIILATREDFAPFPALAAVPLEPPVWLSRAAISRISDSRSLLTRAHDLLSSTGEVG